MNENKQRTKVRRPRVYVPNKSRHDFTKATAFGSLVFITQGLVEKTEVAHMDRLIEDALVDSLSTDYLLPTSFSIISCLLATAFAKKHGRVNYLIFHKDEYVLRTLKYEEYMND